MATEKVRLKIGSLARAVLITGQAYQDPKDALNEFVSNAADEYAALGTQGERIRIVLRRKGRYPVVAIDDDGPGMSPERLREVARSIFKSNKLDDDRTLGEKAIGLLAFQQLGGKCEIVSRADGSTETWMLRLIRGRATAELARERRRARSAPGTTVYISELEPEVLRTITQRKVVDYMRRRRGLAIQRGEYVIEVHEGRSAELVTPEPLEGLRVTLPAQKTLWGDIEFNIYVGAADGRRKQVSVVGRAHTSIIDDIREIEEFDREPWVGGQVTGYVMFPALQQTSSRRAILRDRDAFPVFVDGVRSVEPQIEKVINKVNADIDEKMADRLSSTIRRVFGQVLRELNDLDNPMRTHVGDQPGEGGLFQSEPQPRPDRDPEPPPFESMTASTLDPGRATPQLQTDGEPPPDSAKPSRPGRSRLPTIIEDPDPGEYRSRFDPDEGIVLYNASHVDYLMVKDNEALLLDYLAVLVAKEFVVYNNPMSPPDELAEELVRMLVRVRRHLPKRR
jgi:hypothetical protein